MRGSLLTGLKCGLLVIAGLLSTPAAADEGTIINNPAEKYAIAPGGVDMRTGQYVYSQTDLSIGPESGGLALTRTTPVYVDGHANPFGNFSNDWDIMLVERRISINPPLEAGLDYRMNFHIGGRSFVFESGENSPGFGYKSDGPTQILTFTGGTKDSAAVIYTVQGSGGTLYKFRPMGNKDCTMSRRCAYVSQVTQPDGTVYNFDYAYDGAASGNRARLQRITSSRGYVLMLEGTGSKVTKACVINAANTVPPVGTTCPGTALATATYGYNASGSLTGVTAPDSSLSSFTYTPVTINGTSYTDMGFIKPGYLTPWLTNRLYVQLDEEEVPHEITERQTFADGRTYTYVFDRSPTTINKPIQTIAGGSVTDGHGHQIDYQYDWPILPGSRQRICQPPPCPPPMPDDEYKYTYQQTTGPVLVVDELGRETEFDYCEPAAWEGIPQPEIDRCIINKDYNYFLPERGTGYVAGAVRPDDASGRVEHDSYGNIAKVTKYPKPGSTLAPIITSALYNLGNPKAATKPLWRKDGNGNQTDYTYDLNHGGILTETSPAVRGVMVAGGPIVDGVRPQNRFGYAQRYAWIKSGATYVQAATPVWLIASESHCRTSAWNGSACVVAGDEVVTTYDYGPNSGPNNLLLRGTVVTADGANRRTCFSYDQLGRKISETTPNANLTSCP